MDLDCSKVVGGSVVVLSGSEVILCGLLSYM